jgi:Rrf2 family nitric oxide-sensitive transcriptional repressor
MRLTSYTDYALRVLLYLGARPERHCSISEMSNAYGVSHHHLTKVVHGLVKTGYLDSIRGRLGGVKLARQADRINIGAVVRVMECDFDLVDCANCGISGACGLKGVLQQALRAFLAVLDGYSLADVLAAPADGAGRFLFGVETASGDAAPLRGQ